MTEFVKLVPTGEHVVTSSGHKLWAYDEVPPVLVLDDDAFPRVVVQNDLIRYLFADDPDIEDDYGPPGET